MLIASREAGGRLWGALWRAPGSQTGSRAMLKHQAQEFIACEHRSTLQRRAGGLRDGRTKRAAIILFGVFRDNFLVGVKSQSGERGHRRRPNAAYLELGWIGSDQLVHSRAALQHPEGRHGADILLRRDLQAKQEA